MKLTQLLRPRVVVLLGLWSLPVVLCIAISVIALYQTGWLVVIAGVLPLAWMVAWLVSRCWPPPKLNRSAHWTPLRASDFWTPQDVAAIEVVEAFRRQVADVNQLTIVDPNRYIQDAQELTQKLAVHFHPNANGSTLEPLHVLNPLTLVEILSVIHLAVEDLENWMLENVPGSNLATVGQLGQLLRLAKAWDIGQSIFFIATSIANPSRLLTYPLWRSTGRVTVELQNEVIRAFYQQYLSHIGYYLIEMYSGRLKGGSRVYRQQFGHIAAAVHTAGGDVAQLAKLADSNTTIAVVGQVKAGKSSLINALMKDNVATTSILPETRQVQCFEFALPESTSVIRLLDTPGYSEADISKRQRAETRSAAEVADIILLVMAANVPARQSDVELVRDLQQHYQTRPHLRPSPIIGVFTHIDLLRPVREWTPPYNWRKPSSSKEHSMANAVGYARELFGHSISAYACVYTGELASSDTSVGDELIPLLISHLDQGHASAVLKAFYAQLSQQRFQKLSKQLHGLLKNVGRKLLE